jgi:hypothetical protein
MMWKGVSRLWRKYPKKKMLAVEATVQRVEEEGGYRPKHQRVKQFLLGVTNGSTKGEEAGKPGRLLLCWDLGLGSRGDQSHHAQGNTRGTGEKEHLFVRRKSR